MFGSQLDVKKLDVEVKENQALSNKKISELENELNATKMLLEAQIKKFVRLERSSEACQQHGRG